MNLTQALKAGILPATANPIDIILTSHKEGLNDLLQKQIRRHHSIMDKSCDVSAARQNFQVVSDFTEVEILGMNDLKVWAKEDKVNDINDIDQDHQSSIYLDETSKMAQSFTMINSTLDILKSLRKKKIYHPTEDNSVVSCYNCGVNFSMFNRKHHCRACGRIFCYNCSQWNERIPLDLIRYTDTKAWIVSGQASRICLSCKDIICNYRKIEHLVRYFEIVAYPFDLCIRASTLCRDWREAMRIYLSNIRDIQYALPSAILSDRDIRALKSNSKFIQGHNKWILQSLKMGLFPFEDKRNRQCQDMMCDRNCTEALTMFDAIIILNTPAYNLEVRLLALKILENTITSLSLDYDLHIKFQNSLQSSTPTLISDIALFLPLEDSSVQEFVLKRPDLFLDFFWLSRINKGIITDIFKNKLLLANQDQAKHVQESINLISMLEDYDDLYELSQKLQTLKTPFMGPFNTIDKFDSNIIIKSSVTRPIIINYYSGKSKRAFLYKREDVRKDAHIVSLIRLMYHLCKDIFATCKDSCFLPVSDPINIQESSKRDSSPWFAKDSPILSPATRGSYQGNSSPYRLSAPDENQIYKSVFSFPNDSSFARDAASLLNYDGENYLDSQNISYAQSSVNEYDILGNSESSYLATYRVMPVSVEAGFIEIVPNASTLFDILGRGTISNYLYRSNVNKRVSEVSSNYSASLAFWTVVTYLLGVGDRHLENIMIRDDGILFHIDYGFVFGADSTASFVRLDDNLIEGLGGSEMYVPFKTKCCEIYCCLRRHFNLICACLLRLATIKPPITGYNFTHEFIEKFVTERFLLGQTEEEARGAFSNIIDSSRETLLNKVSDAIHHTVSSLKVGWWSY